MILVFGGTTEGKAVARLLDYLEEGYFYSTKLPSKAKLNGKPIYGDMDAESIKTFCTANNIKLLIDAAHPFAVNLHQNICKAANELELTTIRYEREFPEINNQENIKVFDDFTSLVEALGTSSFDNILSLTGVQTIPHYQKLTGKQTCYFRILNTTTSKQKAKAYGVEDKYVVPSETNFTTEQLIDLGTQVKANVLTSKESGESGFFSQKVEAAIKLDIPLWVVKRPELPDYTNTVNSPKNLLMLLYKLKKTLLKKGDKLRSGYTTGSCVTAAAKACVMALSQKEFPQSVEVTIPNGEKTRFLIFPDALSAHKASCVVIKDGGDDPDVTHGKEIGCEVALSNTSGICFLQGKGIGRVTLPGLQVAVDEPAINPVPRQMIQLAIEQVANLYEVDGGFEVKPFVPEGEELAKQTFNPRVGVEGGISIIGTSGKVIPYSNEAFLATIKHQINVAKESGFDEVVLTSGKRSENILQKNFTHLPETSYIHYGNLVGETIKLASQSRLKKIHLGIMLGKAVKLAEGNLDTHSKKVVFNTNYAAQLAIECGYSESIVQEIRNQKLANAIRNIITFSETEPFYSEVARRCYQVCQKLLPEDKAFSFILIIDSGEKIVFSGQ